MKKKVLSAIAAIVVVVSASAMVVGMQWVCVKDSCGKCEINTIDRKCGKCGGFMNSGKDENAGKGWLKCTFKCKACGHTAVYKYK